MDKNTLVSISTVLKDDASILEAYIRELTTILETHFQHFEIVLVDNGSSDATVAIAKQVLRRYKQIRLLVLSREYDEQVAFTAALESSIGDYVVIMDLNTDPPEVIPEMVRQAMAGADIVTAEVSNRRTQPFTYRLLTNVFYRLSNLLSNYRIDLNSTNFVCLSRKMVNSILQVKDRVRYLKYLKTDIGYSHDTVKYQQINRSGQYSGRTFWNRLFFAFDTLVSNSEKLIRIATSLALLTSLLSFGFIFYALAIKIFKESVPEGWTTTSIILSFMFGVMFFILFIIGEYVSLVFKETRKGPLYHVADEFNSSVLFENIRAKNVI